MDTVTENPTTEAVEASEVAPEQDIIRIPHLLARLERYWMLNPELRLGQIVGNIANEIGKDTYFVEDSAIIEQLEKQAPSW